MSPNELTVVLIVAKVMLNLVHLHLLLSDSSHRVQEFSQQTEQTEKPILWLPCLLVSLHA